MDYFAAPTSDQAGQSWVLGRADRTAMDSSEVLYFVLTTDSSEGMCELYLDDISLVPDDAQNGSVTTTSSDSATSTIPTSTTMNASSTASNASNVTSTISIMTSTTALCTAQSAAPIINPSFEQDCDGSGSYASPWILSGDYAIKLDSEAAYDGTRYM